MVYETVLYKAVFLFKICLFTSPYDEIYLIYFIVIVSSPETGVFHDV